MLRRGVSYPAELMKLADESPCTKYHNGAWVCCGTLEWIKPYLHKRTSYVRNNEINFFQFTT
jgi:hypothetical protein